MAYVVAIIAAGDMGAAVGARLAEHGVRVTTSLAGRSAASAARAERARMVAVADDDTLVGEADFFLSICPPGEAVGLAQRMKPALARSRKKPIYVDCNAISPADRGRDRHGAGRHRLPLRGRRHHRAAAAARPHRDAHLCVGRGGERSGAAARVRGIDSRASTGRSAPRRR